MSLCQITLRGWITFQDLQGGSTKGRGARYVARRPNVPQLKVDGGVAPLDGLEGEIDTDGSLVGLGELAFNASTNDGGLTRANVSYLIIQK